MIKTGIIGVSGYSGATALEILLKHRRVRVHYVSAISTQGKIEDILPRLKGRTTLTCEVLNLKKAIETCEVLFLAVPHTASMDITPQLLKAGRRVIDLSGDYRLQSTTVYKQWYGKPHADKKNLAKAVYGLPELYREKIKKAQLVSNPGCYPTAAILGLAPLMATRSKHIQSIIIDAKSGVSGAGKKLSSPLMFGELDENFKAYKVLNHQHTPEIEQYLSRVAGGEVKVTFVPHLLPVKHGILETIYVTLKKETDLNELQNIYQKFYKTEPFVRVLDKGIQPELKDVVGTNYCDIALTLSADKKMLVVTAAIDNLYKGAAGQAVQNMNIMYGFDETEGLF